MAGPAAASVKPLVIVGPSGVGKGTLINKLMEEFPTQFGFSVSHTTRGPRPGEVDGVHYHFTEKEKILKEISEGKFLEHAEVHGNVYGTSFAALDAVKSQGKICILDIDVQGAESCKRSKLDAVFVFISPPSLEELEKRLRGRGTETEEKITLRLANAKKEYAKKDEPGFFEGVIVNDDLEAAYGRLKDFIGKHIKPLTK